MHNFDEVTLSVLRDYMLERWDPNTDDGETLYVIDHAWGDSLVAKHLPHFKWEQDHYWTSQYWTRFTGKQIALMKDILGNFGSYTSIVVKSACVLVNFD